MSVETSNVVFVRSRLLLLRLNHFHSVGDAGLETVPRLGDLLSSNVQGTGCDLKLLCRRRHVKERGSYFVLDALTQVVEFSLSLLSNAFRLDNVGFDFSPLEDGDADSGRCGEGSMRTGGTGTDDT